MKTWNFPTNERVFVCLCMRVLCVCPRALLVVLTERYHWPQINRCH